MKKDNKPNLIFIMADDMGYGDPGCNNPDSKIPTPNMDKLASEGIRFTDAHSSSAVCTPSRYSVLTGRYCWRTRLKRGVNGGFSLPLIDPSRETIATLAKKAGYQTAAIGKWHVGLEWQAKNDCDKKFSPEEWKDCDYVDYEKPILDGPLQHGFDYFFGIAGSLDMPPYTFIENDRTVGIPSIPKKEYFPQQKEGLQTPDWDDRNVDITFAEKACDFIEKNNKDNPFMLYLTPAAPHRPCLPPEFAQGKSRAGNRGDMVWLVDWVLGRIMDKLEELNLTENTIVCLTSDNGANASDVDSEMWDHKSCGDLRGYKCDIWEGGHRVPFIVRWPEKIQAGQTCHDTIGIFDTIATFAEITEQACDGYKLEDAVSFLDALNGKPSPRRRIIHHSGTGIFAIRDGNWKYITALGNCGANNLPSHGYGSPCANGPRGQLYDLSQDISEKKNLWLEKQDMALQYDKTIDEFKKLYPREDMQRMATS